MYAETSGLAIPTLCALIPEIINDSNINNHFHMPFLKFVNSCSQSDNLMMSLALNGSYSVMCKNINFIGEEYGFHKYNLCNSSLFSM